ncbi:uncharacterized protein METZ01_LOCUS321446 [marine metagenome]|uniref:Uncharacterized protein n=1 Tax=marine metagenome TaxID=408172 RepID=A0A382P9I9_9ZZZZ
MLTVVRDRIVTLIKVGKSLEEIMAENPLLNTMRKWSTRQCLSIGLMLD